MPSRTIRAVGAAAAFLLASVGVLVGTVPAANADVCEDVLCGGTLTVTGLPTTLGFGGDWSAFSLDVTDAPVDTELEPVITVSGDLDLDAQSVRLQQKPGGSWIDVDLTATDGDLTGDLAPVAVTPQEAASLPLRLAVIEEINEPGVADLTTLDVTVAADAAEPTPPPLAGSKRTLVEPTPATASATAAVAPLSIGAPAGVDADGCEYVEAEAEAVNDTGPVDSAACDELRAAWAAAEQEEYGEDAEEGDLESDADDAGDEEEFAGPRRGGAGALPSADIETVLAAVGLSAAAGDVTLEFRKDGAWVPFTPDTTPADLDLFGLAPGERHTSAWRFNFGVDSEFGSDDSITWVAVRGAGPVDEPATPTLVAPTSTATAAGFAETLVSGPFAVPASLPGTGEGPELAASGTDVADRASIGAALVLLGAGLLLLARPRRRTTTS